jgi:hypothetical protein
VSRGRWVALAGLLTACAPKTPVEQPSPQDEMGLLCVPSTPALSPLDTVTLRVAPYDSSASYVWTTSAGRLLDSSATPAWILPDAGLGVHEASVIATSTGGARRRCTLSVRLVPPGGTMGGGLPARSFLARETPESQGYGLYSYLLLGSTPSPAVLPRYRRAIEEYVRLLPAIAAYGEVKNPGEFNINYLPVDAAPAADNADSVLAHYDYARAQVLLRSLPGSHLVGPYLVSSRRPLTAGVPTSGDFIVQDLSVVPETLIGLWVSGFLDQATQERMGPSHSLHDFALRLRTLIGVLALGLPDVEKSMEDWKAKWTKWVMAPSAQ